MITYSISAIFTWQITEDNELKYPGIIQLPGNPLDLSVCPQKDDFSPLPSFIPPPLRFSTWKLLICFFRVLLAQLTNPPG